MGDKIKRMTPEIIKKGRELPKLTKYHVKKLASNETEKWYHSRTVWAGASWVLAGLFSQDLTLIAAGLTQIVARIVTKKPIKLR